MSFGARFSLGGRTDGNVAIISGNRLLTPSCVVETTLRNRKCPSIGSVYVSRTLVPLSKLTLRRHVKISRSRICYRTVQTLNHRKHDLRRSACRRDWARWQLHIRAVQCMWASRLQKLRLQGSRWPGWEQNFVMASGYCGSSTSTMTQMMLGCLSSSDSSSFQTVALEQ